MALPKGVGSLGSDAKELARKASAPITRRLENVREQIATQEGLKNIAFTASGSDPVIGITTGIALGIGALGIGLGAKGLKNSMRGISRLFKTLPEPEMAGMANETQEDIDDSLDMLIDSSSDQLSEMKSFKDQMHDVLMDILDINEKQFELSKGILTNAARERFESSIAESQRLEAEREAERARKAQLLALKGLKGVEDSLGITGGKKSKILTRITEGIIRSLPLIGGGVAAGSVAGGLAARKGLAGAKGLTGATAALSGGVSQVSGKPVKAAKGIKGAGKLAKAIPGLGGVLIGIEALSKANDEFVKSEGDKSRTLAAGVGGILASPAAFIDFLTFGKLGFGEEAQAAFQEKFINLADTMGGIFKDNSIGLAESLSGVIESLPEFTEKVLLTRMKENAQGVADSLKRVFLKLPEFTEAKIEEFKKTERGESLKRLFETFVDVLKTIILESTKNIPVIGKRIAESLLSPDDFAAFERKKEVQNATKKLEKFREQRDKIAARKIGVDISKARKVQLLRATGIQVEKQKQLLRSIAKQPIIASTNRQNATLAELKRESAKLSSQGSPAIISVAPNIVSNTQNQNINNTMVLPLNPQNSESTLDRYFLAQF